MGDDPTAFDAAGKHATRCLLQNLNGQVTPTQAPMGACLINPVCSRAPLTHAQPAPNSVGLHAAPFGGTLRAMAHALLWGRGLRRRPGTALRATKTLTMRGRAAP